MVVAMATGTVSLVTAVTATAHLTVTLLLRDMLLLKLMRLSSPLTTSTHSRFRNVVPLPWLNSKKPWKLQELVSKKLALKLKSNTKLQSLPLKPRLRKPLPLLLQQPQVHAECMQARAQSRYFDDPVQDAATGAGENRNVDVLPGDKGEHAHDRVAMVALESGLPVIFGVLTTDTIEQAIERAGTKAGNKGWSAAMAAVEMANLMDVVDQA